MRGRRATRSRRNAQDHRQLHDELQRAAGDRSPGEDHRQSAAAACRAPNATSVAIIAAFHITGAAYESRNRRWLFRMPRHHADSTSRPAPGNRMRTSAIVSARFSPVKPGAISAISTGVASDAGQHEQRDHEGEKRADRAGHAIGLAPLAARDERGVDGNEGRGERALAEQVLEKVGNAERGVERVGGVGLQAEVVREDAQPHEAGQAARAGCRRRRKRALFRRAAHVVVVVGCRPRRACRSTSSSDRS